MMVPSSLVLWDDGTTLHSKAHRASASAGSAGPPAAHRPPPPTSTKNSWMELDRAADPAAATVAGRDPRAAASTVATALAIVPAVVCFKMIVPVQQIS